MARSTKLSTADIGQWIDNDEGLYDWWKSSRQTKRDFIRDNRAELESAIRSVVEGRKPAHFMKYGENPTKRVLWTAGIIGAAVLLIGGVAFAASRSGGSSGGASETVVYRGVQISVTPGTPNWSATWTVNGQKQTTTGPSRDILLQNVALLIDQALGPPTPVSPPAPNFVPVAAVGDSMGQTTDTTITVPVGMTVRYLPYNGTPWTVMPTTTNPAVLAVAQNPGDFNALTAGTAFVNGAYNDTLGDVTWTRKARLVVNVQ